MKIKRKVNGLSMEFELTKEEIFEAYSAQKHEYDLHFIEGIFGADERFDGLNEEEKAEAFSSIAYRYRDLLVNNDDPDLFELASDAVEDYFIERDAQKGEAEMIKLENLIGYAGAKELIDGFRFCGDWERDQINLSNTLQRHYYDDVGVYNEGIQKAIEDKVNRVIMEKYPDKAFEVDHNGILFEQDVVPGGRYEIEVTIDVVGENGVELGFKMAGNDLEEMKAGLLPAVQKVCAEQGYLDNQVVVGVLIEENGEWFDTDEETFDLGELNVWICSYKDSLGYLDNMDNVTDILVPKAWLLEKLKGEGETDFEGWYAEYTADSTDMIARYAVSEGVVLSCADKRISCVLGLGESFLNTNDYGKRLAKHMREVYKFEYDRGLYQSDGTDIVREELIKSAEDAAGWCLLTYGDRALSEIQNEWITKEKVFEFCGIDIHEIVGVLEKCAAPLKEKSLTERLENASERAGGENSKEENIGLGL